MTKKRRLCGGLWLLLIFLLASPPVGGQTLERIEYPPDEVAASPGDSTERVKRPDYKIHFKLAPKAIDETRIPQMFVWEFQERNAKNAAHSYMRAHTQLTGKLNSNASAEYRHLLTQIWDEAETGGEVDLEFLTGLTLKPIANHDRFIVPEDELTERERTEQRRRLFLNGIEQRQSDHVFFSLREHPEQLEAVRTFVQHHDFVFRFLEEGSRCDFCDFGIPFRETESPIALMLPEIQAMRELARALRVKIMLEVHEKRYEDAIASVRVGLCMARHVGKQPMLVCGLIGISIKQIMLDEVQDMLADADCPNLYWELSLLPYPFLQLVDAAEIEKQIVSQTFPISRKVVSDPDAVLDDEWRLLLRQMDAIANMESDDPTLLDKLPIKSNLVLSYPAARQWLMAQGKTVAEIDAMIPEKAVGMHTVYGIRLVYSQVFRNMYLPLWEECESDETYQQYRRNMYENPLGINIYARQLADLMLPGDGARTAYRRMQMSNDVMRIAEALRDYAARNDGQLPESLDAIPELPIPKINPFTGKAYEYQLVDGVGRIEIPQMWNTVVIFEIEK